MIAFQLMKLNPLRNCSNHANDLNIFIRAKTRLRQVGQRMHTRAQGNEKEAIGDKTQGIWWKQIDKRTTCTAHIQNSNRSVINISVLLVDVVESTEAPKTLRRTLVSTPVNTTRPMT